MKIRRAAAFLTAVAMILGTGAGFPQPLSADVIVTAEEAPLGEASVSDRKTGTEAGTGAFSLVPSAAAVQRGDEFTVELHIDSNPGINSLNVDIEYDTSAFRLTYYSYVSNFFGADAEEVMVSGFESDIFALSWIDANTADSGGDIVNFTGTGRILTLKFKAQTDAALGEHSFRLKHNANNLFRATGTVSAPGGFENVPFTATDCKVSVAEPLTAENTAVTLGTSSFTYDGTEKTPSAEVKYGTKTLTEDTDYTLTYENNTDAGTACAVITGMGKYMGTVKKQFTISPKNISLTTATLAQTTYSYDGTAKQPAVTVRDGSTTLTAGTDYTVTYSSNVSAGTATATVTGKGNYTGSLTKNFTIGGKSLTNTTVTLGTTSFTYDGSEKKPAVTVKDGSKVLTAGTDYTVSFEDNVNAGTATVTVMGIGGYSDSVTQSFTISPRSVSGVTVELSSTSYTYDGSRKYPSVTVTDGGRTLGSSDYNVSYSNNMKVGTGTVTVNGKGNYTGTVTADFTINARSIAEAEMTLSAVSYAYDGSAKKPSVTITDGSRTLYVGTDYRLSFTNNVNVGTATVTATGIGNYTGTLSANYSITGRSLSDAAIALGQTSFVYDGTAKTPSVTVTYGTTVLRAGTDYTAAYSGNVNAGTATVTVTGRGRYEGTLSTTFTITPKSILAAEATLSRNSYIYDGTAKTPAVTITDGSTTLAAGTDYTVTYANNVSVGKASAIIVGKGNYTGTITADFTIQDEQTGHFGLTSSASFAEPGDRFTVSFSLDADPGINSMHAFLTYDSSAFSVVSCRPTGNFFTGSGTDILCDTSTAGQVGISWAVSDKTDAAGDIIDFKNTGTAVTVTFEVKAAATPGEHSFGIAYDSGDVFRTVGNLNTGSRNVTVPFNGNGCAVSVIRSVPISSADIILSPASYTYDGTVKQPAVTVNDGSKTLVEGVDYTVGYTDNVDAGTATAVITGCGSYTGTASKTFTISPKSVSDAAVTLSQSSYVYDGTAKSPSVTVKDGGRTLMKGSDYTISYTNNVRVGQATVTITGIGNYTGTQSRYFTIESRETGRFTLTPAVNTVAPGGSFSVVLSIDANPGINSFRIPVKYDDSFVLTGCTLTNYFFTGSTQNLITSPVTSDPYIVMWTDMAAADGSGNRVQFYDTGTLAVLTFRVSETASLGEHDFTMTLDPQTQLRTLGSKSETANNELVTFAVTDCTVTVADSVSISPAEITLSPAGFIYDGTAKRPDVTVVYGSETLEENTDYTLSYENDTDAGTAGVTVTGIGRYSGSVKKSYTISRRSVGGCDVTMTPSSFTYDGAAKQPAVTVKDGSRTLTAGTDYTVAISNNIDAGTPGVKITGCGNYTGTLNKTFTINRKNVSGLTVTLQTSHTYDGTAKQPAVTVKDGSRTLVSGTDYTLTYSSNVNVGTATVTVTGMGNYTGSAAKYFTIGAKLISDTFVTLGQNSYVYDGTAKKPSVTITDNDKMLVQGTDYSVVYSSNIGAGTASVKITGSGNYSGTVTKTFTIAAKPISGTTVTLGQTSYAYDGTAKQPAVTVTDGSRTLVSGTDYTVAYSNNVQAGTALVTVTGKGNYSGTADATFIIERSAVLYGDVDGDGKVDNADISRFQQHFAGWIVTIDMVASDADANGVVDPSDLALLQKYRAGWTVILGPQ